MRKKKQAEPILPFGKHKGKTLATVLREEPSYLCWFVETVDGYNDLKEAIFALSDFQQKQAIHYARQRAKKRQLASLLRRAYAASWASSSRRVQSNWTCCATACSTAMKGREHDAECHRIPR